MKLFRSYSDKQIGKVTKLADKVMALDHEMAALTDDELKAKTTEFKKRYANGESLDDLLPEAFAVCREADWRVLGMKPYKVQVIGGIILHQGRIAEMKTGEGKTLVATLPAYLNALTGRGVHIVTVNDYLAKRDSEQNGKVYRFLGLSVGLIIHEIEPEDRKAMYAADITYGTNNEFGFDYLRDNMAVDQEAVVQRDHYFAIVDEVDSILIDEARTPLIISGQDGAASPLYQAADMLAKQFIPKKVKEFDKTEDQDFDDADYLIDEKGKNVILTTRGIKKSEKFFSLENLADEENQLLMHHIMQAVKANGIMKKDIDYIVKDGEVVIVDEFTGRLMPGRRFNDGLHQAIEAKEHVEVASESKTYATITFQNFFRIYDKLSGMTGTALTEEEEFQTIYKLDVVVVPTNKPVIRKDHEDSVYANVDAKLKAIVKQIQLCHAKSQPVLVGTVSVEKSEKLSSYLKKFEIPHQVLNAKNHELEAKIIAQAGRSGAVTIATNMAGRGTDIVLGGNPDYMAIEKLRKEGIDEEVITEAIGYAETKDESIIEVRAQFHNLCDEFKKETERDAELVRSAGGLFILGTERHESRRIDNQLRGRAGRQGDPGESRFFLCLEDPLLRLFIPDGAMKNMVNAGLDGDEPIRMKVLSRSIENAQKRLEGRNFDIRKNVLEYDDIMNQQRQQIYAIRRDILHGTDLKDAIAKMRKDFLTIQVDEVMGDSMMILPDKLKELDRRISNSLVAEEDLDLSAWSESFRCKNRKKLKAEMVEHLDHLAQLRYEKKEQIVGSDYMRKCERVIFLKTIDRFWMEHIDAMSHLKDGIGLESYAQHDPVIAYKERAFTMYEEMIRNIRVNTIYGMYKFKIRPVEGEVG